MAAIGPGAQQRSPRAAAQMCVGDLDVVENAERAQRNDSIAISSAKFASALPRKRALAGMGAGQQRVQAIVLQFPGEAAVQRQRRREGIRPSTAVRRPEGRCLTSGLPGSKAKLNSTRMVSENASEALSASRVRTRCADLSPRWSTPGARYTGAQFSP